MSTVQATVRIKELLGTGLALRCLAAAGIVAVPLAALWWARNGWSWQTFLDWQQQIDAPTFFAALALLPLVGVPTTPLFVVAGAAFDLTTALTGSAVAIALNVALSYWLARNILRRPLIGWLRRWDYQLPHFTPGKALSFLILMRLAPGLPAFLKNYATALFDVPFGIYLAISWLITFSYAVSMIVLGDSLYHGDLREGAGGLLLLLGVVAGFAWIHKRQQKIFADGGEDKISALRQAMSPSPSTLSYPALTVRVLKMIALLTLLWGILAQNAGWAFASEAIIAAVLASLFFALLLPTHYSLGGLLLFACYFVVEALRGGFDVARRALHPGLPITPHWIDYPLTLPPGAPQVLFLNSVSLLPGTLSAALDGNVAKIHGLGSGQDAALELARLEYWVMRVFAAPGERT
jgi:multisubunit Na+/H+ antiporter MnhE subunit/uncharacterized membrane protein YdjX (TVP38/TMEM64 family)